MRFVSISDVEHQQVMRVTNKVTWDEAIFNQPVVHDHRGRL